eukprot:1648551-Prymnesium_polylepis.1
MVRRSFGTFAWRIRSTTPMTTSRTRRTISEGVATYLRSAASSPTRASRTRPRGSLRVREPEEPAEPADVAEQEAQAGHRREAWLRTGPGLSGATARLSRAAAAAGCRGGGAG